MKRDLEAWFPVTGGGEYKELVSISNCTDYQTRELEIRFGVKKQTATRKDYVHALNGTRKLTSPYYKTEQGKVSNTAFTTEEILNGGHALVAAVKWSFPKKRNPPLNFSNCMC